LKGPLREPREPWHYALLATSGGMDEAAAPSTRDPSSRD
jgi:hypothetical protein